jgi:hypothetical protein
MAGPEDIVSLTLRGRVVDKLVTQQDPCWSWTGRPELLHIV